MLTQAVTVPQGHCHVHTDIQTDSCAHVGTESHICLHSQSDPQGTNRPLPKTIAKDRAPLPLQYPGLSRECRGAHTHTHQRQAGTIRLFVLRQGLIRYLWLAWNLQQGPSWSRTHSDLPILASQVRRLKACAIMPCLATFL